jgi:DNA-binding transcriptional regulator PaaX
MTEPTVESIFGTKAGVVWEFLNKIGPSNIDNIVKATGMRRELVYAALGWLGRENKIVVERRGRAMVFSLQESEIRREAAKATTMEDSAPQKQSKRRRSTPPKRTAKKTTKAPKVKAPLKQSDRMDEFLLH